MFDSCRKICRCKNHFLYKKVDIPCSFWANQEMTIVLWIAPGLVLYICESENRYVGYSVETSITG